MSGGGTGFGTIPDIIMGKDPKKALMDNILSAGAVLTGGAMLPAMGASAAAAPEMASGAFLGEGAASGIPAWDAAGSGGNLLSLLQKTGEYAKPIGQAASAAGQAGLLGGQRQPIAASPMMAPNMGGNQILGQLAQGGTENMQQMQLAEQMRQRRRMGLMGGGYGSA